MTTEPGPALAEPGADQFFLNATGRIGRAAFLAGVGGLVLTLQLYQALVGGWLRWATAGALYVALFCTGGVLLAKRLHDRGRSGWWAAPILFSFIAVWPDAEGSRALLLPVLLAAAVDLGVLQGEHRFNRFGPEPLRN